MRFVILALAALPLGACATVTRGTTEQVAFQSEPSGAEVTTSTGLSCSATPCSIEIPRKDQFIATFTKPGYRPQQVTVGTQVAGGGTAGLAGNVLIGGIVGVVVDSANGSALDHTPNPVMASLAPGALPSAQKKRVRKAPAVTQLPAAEPQS